MNPEFYLLTQFVFADTCLAGKERRRFKATAVKEYGKMLAERSNTLAILVDSLLKPKSRPKWNL